MRIPKSMPMLGHTIQVVIFAPEAWPHTADCVGMWEPSLLRVSLHGSLSGSAIEQVFFHELTHACLTLMSHKLAYNEVFVDQFASLLHQSLSGAKYPSNRKKVCQPPTSVPT